MFHDLDATLRAMLGGQLGVENVDVSFAAPDDRFPPVGVTLPAVSFFLYDVRENHELRTNQWEQVKREDGMVTRQRPPVRVDCSYLITAWPSDTTDDAAHDEHLLLGEVMKVLLRHRHIPADYLQGELAGHEPPVRARVLSENQLHSLGELWQAMGGRPKAALHYGLTLSIDVLEPREVGRAVESWVLNLELSQGTGPG